MENFNQNTAGGQGGNVPEGQGITNTAGAQGKTYTQDEVDNMINAALGKKLSGMPTKEELAEFKNWKKSQKTEEEKKAERERNNHKRNYERNIKKKRIMINILLRQLHLISMRIFYLWYLH